MIVNPAIRALWDKYGLPDEKRVHMRLVAAVSGVFADALGLKGITIRRNVLIEAALLHDIDKNVLKLAGEKHPDAAVRILREEGRNEAAELVRTHPLHSILDRAIAPRTWEEKILYLSDKMVKQQVITVDERFRLWRGEKLPDEGLRQLEACYPKVKKLETELFTAAGLNAEKVAELAVKRYT